MANSATVGILRAILSLDSAEFDKGIRKVNDGAKALTKDLKAMGQQASNLGAALTKTLTLPIAGLGIAAAKAAIDFESSFAGVGKTVDGVMNTSGDLTALGKEIAQSFRNLAKEIPVSVHELNRIGEAAGALGIKKDDLTDFTSVMAQLGVTTNLTSDEAANAIARIQNIFGAAGKDTERLASTLVALGNAGASTETEIVAMAQRIAGAGHTVGLTQAQVLSFASTLASVGINAEAGGSAISRIFLKMNDAVMKGGDGLKEFARVADMKAADFKKAFQTDAAGATQAFIEGLGRLRGQGENINATIEKLTGKNIILKDTLFRLAGAGKLLNDQLALGNEAWQQNTALSEEAQKRFATLESKLILLRNKFQDIAITLGTALLPMIEKMIGGLDKALPLVERLAEGFAKLPLPIQATAVAAGALAAAAGPMLFVAGQMMMAFSTLTAAFTKTGIATRALTGIFGEKGVAARGLASAYNGLVPAVRAISSGWTGLASIGSRLVGVFGGLGTGAGAMLGPLAGVAAAGAGVMAWLLRFTEVGPAVSAVFSAWMSALRELTGLWGDVFKAGIAVGIDAVTALRDKINSLVSTAFAALKDAFVATKERAGEFWTAFNAGLKVAAAASGNVRAIVDSLGFVKDRLLAIVSGLREAREIAQGIIAVATGPTLPDVKSPAGLRPAALGLPSAEDLLKVDAALSTKINRTLQQTADAADEAAKALQKMADELTGKKLADEMAELAKAVALANKQGGIAKTELPKLVAKIDEWRKAGLKLDPVLDAVGKSQVSLTATVTRSTQVLRDHIAALPKATLEWQKYVNAIKAADFAKLVNATPNGDILGIGRISWDRIREEGESAIPPVRDYGKALQEVTRSFEVMANIGGGALDAISRAVGTSFATLSQLAGAAKLLKDADKAVKGLQISWENFAAGAAAGLSAVVTGTIALGNAIDQAMAAKTRHRNMTMVANLIVDDFDIDRLRLTQDLLAKILSDAEGGWNRMRRPGSGRFGQQTQDESLRLAELLNLNGLMDAAGALTPANLQTFQAAALELFDAIASGAVGVDRLDQATDELSQAIERFAKHAETTGGLWSEAFKEILKRAQETGIAIEAANAAIAGQINTLAAATNTVVKGGIDSQIEFDRLSRIAFATFNGMIAQGKSAREAIEAIGPAIVALRDVMQKPGEEGGFAAGPALDELLKYEQFATANANLLDSASALNQVLAASANLGILTAESFADLQAQGRGAYDEIYNAAIRAGFGQEQAQRMALEAVAPMLESIIALHKERGLAISEESQQLIDAAREEGVLKDKQLTTNDILKEGLGTIIRLLGGELPKAWRDMADEAKSQAERAARGITTAFSGLAPRIPVSFALPDGMDGSFVGAGFEPIDAPTMDAPVMAVQRSGFAFLNKGDIAGMPSEGVLMDGAGGGSGALRPVVLQVDGRELARVMVPLMPGEIKRLGLTRV